MSDEKKIHDGGYAFPALQGAEMKTLTDLRAESDSLRKKICQLEEMELAPKRKALLGKCFKYRNCYSLPEKPSDYWFLYLRVMAISGSTAICQKFQIDKDGKLELDLRHRKFHPEGLITDGSNYIPISEAEFLRAKRRIKRLVNKW